MADKNRPLRLGMHTYTLHFFGFGESWGFGKDYYFDQVMSLYELMDKAEEWGLDGLQITKVDLLATGSDTPFAAENPEGRTGRPGTRPVPGVQLFLPRGQRFPGKLHGERSPADRP